MTTRQFVIIGAGHAGAQLAASLRDRDAAARIVLVGEEPHLPYNRPPLSKQGLSEAKSIDDLAIRRGSYYVERGIDLRTGVRAVAVEAAGRRVLLEDGSALEYDALALATGSRPRRLDVPGIDLAGVVRLQNYANLVELRQMAGAARRVAIIGAGFIGLEVAASLRKAGCEVTVLESAPRVLARVASPELSAVVAAVHAEKGVRILTGVVVIELQGRGRIESVLCADGNCHPADLVVVGIGAVPNAEIATRAGLQTNEGIVVDRHARSSDVAIYAAGDCARYEHRLYGGAVRLESVQNATEQAKIAATNMVGGDASYAAVPWFWSDQFDAKIQMAGLRDPADTHIVQDVETEGGFLALSYRDGLARAVEAVNMPRDFMQTRRLIEREMANGPADHDAQQRALREGVA